VNARNPEACIKSKDISEVCSVDSVFKEACLAVLPRARNVLSLEQFNQIIAYASEKLKDKITLEVQPLVIQG